jgi:UrcA family protein
MKNVIDSALVRLPGVAAALVLASGFAGIAAAATPADDVPQIVVRYGDLNLQTDAGLQALHRRLSHAAGQVCGVPASKIDLARAAAVSRCQNEAIARAIRALPNEHLVEVMITRFKVG